LAGIAIYTDIDGDDEGKRNRFCLFGKNIKVFKSPHTTKIGENKRRGQE